jgi:hypothetical protein
VHVKTSTRIAIGAASVVLLLVLAGCGSTFQGNNKANNTDRDTTRNGFEKLQASQPTPIYDYSQLRQNLIEIQDAQANSTQTTSFFFLEGVGLIGSCPSIGFPVASTTQLTNPESKYSKKDFVITQGEPTGVYTAESTGTYTICVDGDGQPYANYFEGYVQTVTGPAEFKDGQIVLTGAPTGDFTKGE